MILEYATDTRRVWASYADGSTVSPRSGAALMVYAGDLAALGRLGDLPEGWPASAPDPRPCVAPAALGQPSSRVARGTALVHALDKETKVSPRDLAYVAGLTAAREDMESIARIATVDGSTAKAWFDRALGAVA